MEKHSFFVENEKSVAIHLVRGAGVERGVGKASGRKLEVTGRRNHGAVVAAQGQRRGDELNTATLAKRTQCAPQMRVGGHATGHDQCLLAGLRERLVDLFLDGADLAASYTATIVSRRRDSARYSHAG